MDRPPRGCRRRLHLPRDAASFHAIGQFYLDFSQTSDDEVVDCLERARATTATPGRDEQVELLVGRAVLPGHLAIPPGARALVVFADQGGHMHHSAGNRRVARVLNKARIGTLLFDPLMADEERDRADVFDVRLLAGRVSTATAWLRATAGLRLPIGYFGAGAGAAVALWAASEPDAGVAAVVSSGGRPDLAGERLDAVRAPTLLIVGGRDTAVAELNRRAQARLRCESHLAIVPGATHLFEEPGALDSAAGLARDWFTVHVVSHVGRAA